MRRLITPGRLAAVGLVLLAALALVVWVAPADSYLILPDRAKPLAERVEVPNEVPDKDGGGIYFVDVIVRKASVLEERVGRFRPDGAELVPEEAIVPPGTDFDDRRRQNLREMDRSQEVATAVALRELGYDVQAEPEGATVVGVAEGAPADGKLEPDDVIVGVDGKPVQTPEDLRRLIATREIGDPVRIRVRGGGTTRTVELDTIESPVEKGRPIIGVQVEQFADIEFPSTSTSTSAGSAARRPGLAFALQILEELGEEVDRGNRVAATGEIQLDGGVAPVGGLKQKTIGARRAGADVFLVPAGENAEVARENADGLRIIPVHNFQQALRALKTLPRKQ